MLGKYLIINSVQYPNPISYSDNSVNCETVTTSEGNTDLTSVQRLLKFQCTMTFQLSSYWADKLDEDCKKLKSYVRVGKNVYEGRLRRTSRTLAQYSENSRNTDGYWNVSVTFIER